jgi:serine/threonine-protein kinase
MSGQRSIGLFLAIMLAPTAAHAADPPEPAGHPAASETLFYEARALMQRGKYAEACPKLEESLRLEAGIGTRFNLADCNEKIGKIATAWAGFLEVAEKAKAANQTQRERIARERAAALEPRLPRLVIDVDDAPEGIEVARDGVAVRTRAWGTAIPVDPGPHVITASAPSTQPWETTVTAREGTTSRVAVAKLAAAPALTAAPFEPPARAAVGRREEHAPTDFPPPVVEAGSAQRNVGWVFFALGAASIGVGAGFGLSSLSKRDEARKHCRGDLCDATGVALRDDAMKHGNVSTITTIAGGAALLLGLTLVLTAPSRTERSVGLGSLRAVPSVAATGGGLLVHGSLP